MLCLIHKRSNTHQQTMHIQYHQFSWVIETRQKPISIFCISIPYFFLECLGWIKQQKYVYTILWKFNEVIYNKNCGVIHSHKTWNPRIISIRMIIIRGFLVMSSCRFVAKSCTFDKDMTTMRFCGHNHFHFYQHKHIFLVGRKWTSIDEYSLCILFSCPHIYTYKKNNKYETNCWFIYSRFGPISQMTYMYPIWESLEISRGNIYAICDHLLIEMTHYDRCIKVISSSISQHVLLEV